VNTSGPCCRLPRRQKSITTKAWNTSKQGNLQRIHSSCERMALSLQIVLRPFALPGSISSVAISRRQPPRFDAVFHRMREVFVPPSISKMVQAPEGKHVTRLEYTWGIISTSLKLEFQPTGHGGVWCRGMALCPHTEVTTKLLKEHETRSYRRSYRSIRRLTGR
jgi:hypothetical protein